MEGRITIQTVPVVNAINPVSMNASGSLIAGALAPSCEAETTGLAVSGLTAADMGNEASIGLFSAFTRETAGFELGVKVHGAAIRLRAERRTRREGGDCLQNRYQGLRWLKSACVQVDELGLFSRDATVIASS